MGSEAARYDPDVAAALILKWRKETAGRFDELAVGIADMERIAAYIATAVADRPDDERLQELARGYPARSRECIDELRRLLAAGNEVLRELDGMAQETEAGMDTQDLVTLADAHARLQQRMQALAPALSTFRQWATPYYRRTHPGIGKIMPRAHHVRGSSKVWYAMQDVERLIDDLLAGKGAKRAA